jgi:hypothetical protein
MLIARLKTQLPSDRFAFFRRSWIAHGGQKCVQQALQLRVNSKD